MKTFLNAACQIMSDDAKIKSGDTVPERTADVCKIESGNLANQIKIDPKLLKEVSVPTNAHSGSAGGDQNESIGIDFGNGNVVSRRNQMTEVSAVQVGTEFKRDGLPNGSQSKSTSPVDASPLPSSRFERPPLPLPPSPNPIHYEKPPLPSPILAQNLDTSAGPPPLPSPKPIHFEKPPLPSAILVQNQRLETRPAQAPVLVPEIQSQKDTALHPEAAVFAASDLLHK